MARNFLILRDVKKSLIASSLALLLYPTFGEAVGPINNNTNGDQQVEVGDATTPDDTLTGGITTSGNNSSTNVNFNNGSSMTGGDIKAETGGRNTIELKDSSSMTAGTIKAEANSTNTLTDTRTTTTTKSTITKVEADGGTNNLKDLKNFDLKAVEAKNNGKNTIGLQADSTITGAITANGGGQNTITLQDNATINATGAGGNISADGNNSINNITGNTTGNNSVGGKIEAKNSGQNTIDLTNLSIGGDGIEATTNGTNQITLGTLTGANVGVSATQGGRNTLTINTSGDLKNIIADGAGSSNTLTLNGTTKITGYIEAKASGTNEITLNDNAKIESTATTGTGDSILADGQGSRNTIKGDTTADNSIGGNVEAKDGGSNEITLNQLTVKGDLKANGGGTNSITLNQGGSVVNVTTDGQGSSNTFTLGGGGQITGYIEAKNSGANTITLNDTAKINFTGNAQNGAPILADGQNSSNTISGTTTDGGSINGSIEAKNQGQNNITLSQLEIKGDAKASAGGQNNITLQQGGSLVNVTADGQNSTNTLTLGGGAKITGYIEAKSGGVNTIALNGNAKLESTATTGTKASILAEGQGSSNTINGDTADGGNIGGDIEAKDNGTNTITLSSLVVDGDAKATQGGRNTITLNQGGSLVNVIADGTNSSNNLTLGGTAKITGYIEAKQGGTNTITLNNTAKIESTTVPAGGASILADGNGSSNTINGTSADAGNINGNIEAKNGGANTIDLNTFTIGGDVKADGGTNTIDLKTGGVITGNILAEVANSVNTITLGGNAKANGYVSAKNGGQNTITLNDNAKIESTTPVTGSTANIFAEGQNSSNTINGDSADAGSINGNIEAKNGGQNTIELNTFSIGGNVKAEGGTNSVTLKTGGGINGNILAESANSTNTISLAGNAKIAGYVSAANATGTNTLTLDGDSKLEGYISATQGGQNTLTLSGNQNLDIKNTATGTTASILADGNNSTNTINGNATDGGTISGGILAKGQGSNTINVGGFVVNGDTKAEANSTNTIGFTASGSLGNIIAEGQGAKNTITLGGTAKIKGFVSALNGGQNTITLNDTAGFESIATTTGTAGILADGNNSSNTITGNTTDGGSIKGGILAKNQGANTINLDSLIVQGETKAEANSSNTVTLNEGGSLGNVTADGTQATNTITLGGDAKVAGNVTASNDGTNTFTMGGNSSMLGYVSATNGVNTVTLSDTSHLDLHKGQNNTAVYATTKKGNEIKGDSTGAHRIEGNVVADTSGENEIELGNLTLTGGIEAKNRGRNNITLKTKLTMTGDTLADTGGQNIFKVSDDTGTENSTITGNITAQGANSRNDIEFYLTQVTGTIKADDHATNELKLYGGGVNGKILATNSGTNTIHLGNATKQTRITGSIESDTQGSNTITLENAVITNGIIANNQGTNTITITSKENYNSASDITANDQGSNTVKFQEATISGTITANTGGQNTIDDTATTGGGGGTLSKLIGSVVANGGTNTMTFANMEITDTMRATNSGTNTTEATTTLLKVQKIEAENGTNTIKVKAGKLETTSISAETATSNNTITLESGNATLELVKAQNQVVLHAKDKGAKNTITDNATGDNIITGNMEALDAGENDVTLKKVDMTGDIFAKNKGKNTITFGEAGRGVSTLTGHVIADDGTNTLTLNNLNFTGSAQALSDGATNTINLTKGKFNAYLVAISQTADSKNEITLNQVEVTLTGTQVKNKDGQDVGTGNDAIYTEGEHAKNIINDDPTNQWIINGNITAFNGGKNDYDFLRKVSMTGSLDASITDAKNTITITNDSFIQDGYASARGDRAYNEVTLKEQSQFRNMYLEAISDAGEAKNTLTIQDTAKMALTANPDPNSQNAVLAENDKAQNLVSGDSVEKNTITGRVLAKTAGQNNITLESLDITGDIRTEAGGRNTIIIGAGGNAQAPHNNNNVTGNVSAMVGANTLNFNNTTLTSGVVEADGVHSSNHITFGEISDFTIGDANNPALYALYANEADAKNLITQAMDAAGAPKGTTTGTISGNVIARRQGENKIEKIEQLKIQNGFVESSNKSSKNDIVTNKLVLNLIASPDGNAILANNLNADNILRSMTMDNQIGNNNMSTIKGNILANDGGRNGVMLASMQATGNLIARNTGLNMLFVGDKTAGATNATGSFFKGSVFATDATSRNEVGFYAETLLEFAKSTEGENAILARGENARNTITGSSTQASNVMGDITAIHTASNTITPSNLSITGNIIAKDAGKNTLKFEGSQRLEIKSALSDGVNTINSLVSNSVGVLSGLLIAKNRGENDFRVSMTGATAGAPAPTDIPTLDIITESQGKNTAIIQNTTSAKSNMFYNDGATMAIFAKSNTVTNESGTAIDTEQYDDGLAITPNAKRANDMLKDFRKTAGLETNFASFELSSFDQKEKNITIGGVFVGKIEFFKTTGTDNIFHITLKDNTAIITRLAPKPQDGIRLELGQGARWVVTPHEVPKVNIKKLESSATSIDPATSMLSTLEQHNTIIDVATAGVNVKYGVSKGSFTDMTVGNAGKLDNTIFRLYADTVQAKADKVVINSLSDDTNNAMLQMYYTQESLQKASQYPFGQKVLVAKVKKDASHTFEFDISKPTTVEQGYKLIMTEFEKKQTQSSGTTMDEYYIKRYGAELNPDEANKSFAMLGVNYLVYLANTNNINKRLGEKRGEELSDSFWIRTYGGQIVQNQGLKVTNNYVSAQAGYDYGFLGDGSMHFLGLAFGYGFNMISSSAWKMHSQLLSGAFYYSYVRDSGVYSDTILKYDAIDTKPQAYDLKDNIKSGALSLTQEVGYRLYFGASKNMFMEFQAEGIMGYLLGFKVLQMSNVDTLEASVGDFLAFRGRVGSVFAYRLKTASTQTDFRFGASYVGDFDTAKYELDSAGTKASLQNGYNQMVVATLGVNSYLTKNLRLYFETEAAFLGTRINQTFGVNLGLRYSFGTTKKVDYDTDVKQEKASREYATINISAEKTKCNGCNPESAYYLKVISLPRANAGLGNYLAKFGYRMHTQDKQVIYYVGPYKTLAEAKGKKDFASKIAQALSKNPEASAEIYKINNAKN